MLNKNTAQIFNPNIILKIVAIASEGVSNLMIQGGWYHDKHFYHTTLCLFYFNIN